MLTHTLELYRLLYKIMTVLPLSIVRQKLPQLIKTVSEGYERIVITVHGKEKAVILSPEELEAYEDTIEILSNPETMAAIARSEEDFRQGNVITHEELLKKLS